MTAKTRARKPKPKPRPVGAPTKYTRALADAVCSRLAAGESLRAICRDPDMPSRETVRLWREGQRNAGAEFAGRYARAQDEKADLYAEQVLIESRAALTATTNHEVQARKLMADNLKWTASRMLPRRWGDKVEIAVGGAANGAAPLLIDINTMSSEQRLRELADLAGGVLDQEPIDLDAIEVEGEA